MTEEELRRLVGDVAGGRMDPGEAVERLVQGPFRRDDLGFATLDHHRSLRQGMGEVVFGQGKTPIEIVAITRRLAEQGRPVLVTRLSPGHLREVLADFPDARFNERAGTLSLNPPSERGSGSGEPFVAIVSGGTSDQRVAEEAAETCIAMDVAVERYYDVGVAGLHRVLAHLPALRRASALVVVAGMEGALPSVVGGLVAQPVFAVPTSVGYGASFEGIAALLAMLNSCAPGITVTNIDGGFSAGMAAARVVRAIRGTPTGPS